MGKTNFTGANWLNFIKEYKTNGELYQGESNPALLSKFIYTTALGYYKKNLETYNPEFKYQMAEFKEGNMLFEIMEKKVWSKAAGDSAGLHNYYLLNKNKYKWASSATVILFNCNNKATADKAIADLKAGKDWKKILEDGNNGIQADSGRYELSQIPVNEGTKLIEKIITNAVVNTLDGSASFVKVLKMHNANEQRSYDEAKGLIINDYQTVVEEQWIAELKKKYPIRINEEVYKSLLK
ncbi:MAG: hypothetical protein IPP48_09785 [Chitinophagaceae bacterium]|nr:hypothetical protein [Chitinophagaceae bacterium]